MSFYMAHEEAKNTLRLSLECRGVFTALHIPHPPQPFARHDGLGAAHDRRQKTVQGRDIHRFLESLCIQQELVQFLHFLIGQWAWTEHIHSALLPWHACRPHRDRFGRPEF